MSIEATLARYLSSDRFGNWIRPYFARPFGSRESRCRLCVYYEPSRIAFSEIYPFLHYSREIRDMWGVEARFITVDRFMDQDKSTFLEADVYLIQPWFTIQPAQLRNALERLVAARPKSRIVFLDAFAHNDLRLAHSVNDYVEFYLKKSLFRDTEKYFRSFRGDTNLTDYYGELFGIEAQPVDWNVPRSILPKLKLWPSFFTSPNFLRAFESVAPPKRQPRSIDVHARLSSHGTEWYQKMREACIASASSLSDMNVVKGTGVPWRQFMQELRNSKACFSPFGYGEICWRDIEGYLAGSVLVKPDMSHLRTILDIYRANETYLPIRWDLEDFEDVMRACLRDEELRHYIATNAFYTIRNYIVSRKFAIDLDYLFA